MTESPSRYERRTIKAIALFLTRALLLAVALPVFGNTITVMNTNDSGPGSLRQALADAASGDTIAFNLPNPSVISLSSNALYIQTNLTIQGPGPTQLAIRGYQAVEVLLIYPGVTASISGLTIENGRNAAGGGIYNLGTLTVTNCTIADNFAGPTFAGGDGGGIYNGGTLTVANSTISGNIGTLHGAGIFNAGTLTVLNSTISGNSGDSGIFNGNGGPPGGPLATLTVLNSTFSGNSHLGIANAGTATVTSSTFTGNQGGAIESGGRTDILLTVKNTLLTRNAGENCLVDANTYTGDLSQGYNLSDDTNCSRVFSATTDKNNTPAGLDPKGLQNNGGPAQTIALLPTSPAVDAIPAGSCTDINNSPLTTDQRGIARPQGSGCDIGAFELVQNTPFSYFSTNIAILTGKPSGFGLTVWFSLGNVNNGIHPLSEAITLQIANYTVTIPPGSLHQLWNSPQAPYAYTGTTSGTKLVLGLIDFGRNNYQLDVAGSPVAFTAGIKNPVTVSLTIGNDTGSAAVTALISPR